MAESGELSREELLALIGDLRASLDAKDARLDALLVQVGELTAQVQALVLRLGKDSQSSSKPPSSDGPNRRPRGGSSRTKSGLKPGKQPGAEGKTLQLVADPDETISIPAPSVCGCGTHLVETPVVSVRRRQVTDIPEAPAPFVTEYAADVKTCPGCSKPAVGDFPEGVDAPVQYGPEVHAKAADITLAHHVPIHRSTILLMELCGISVSTGFMASLRGKAARILEATFMPAVQALLATAPVAHADETFTRTAGHTVYLHVVCTEYLTLMHAGDRSGATIDAGGVLTKLTGVLVRDGYVGYKHLTNVLHAWCSAHLLRDLRGIHEGDPEGQLWAKALAARPWPTPSSKPTGSPPWPGPRAATNSASLNLM
jgi:transposase